MLRNEASVSVFILDASRIVKTLNGKECRSILRKNVYQLLFSYFDIGEEDLIQNRFGKKYVATSNENKHFNISYSNQLAVLAISDEDVGIDIEYLNRRVPSHLRSILNIDYDKANIDFYYKWTCIESSSKLLGVGLANGFRNIQILQNSSFECYHKGFFHEHPCYFYNKLFDEYLITVCLNTPKIIHFIKKKL